MLFWQLYHLNYTNKLIEKPIDNARLHYLWALIDFSERCLLHVLERFHCN